MARRKFTMFYVQGNMLRVFFFFFFLVYVYIDDTNSQSYIGGCKKRRLFCCCIEMVIYTLRVNKKLFYFKRGHPVFVISWNVFFLFFFKWVYAIGILRLPFNEMDFNLCEKKKHFFGRETEYYQNLSQYFFSVLFVLCSL